MSFVGGGAAAGLPLVTDCDTSEFTSTSITVSCATATPTVAEEQCVFTEVLRLGDEFACVLVDEHGTRFDRQFELLSVSPSAQ